MLTLSDQLPKLDAQFTGVVSKLLDTLRSLVEDPEKSLSQHARVNDRSAEEYLIPGKQGGSASGWRWDQGRWGSGGKVGEVVDALTKVRAGFDPEWSRVGLTISPGAQLDRIDPEGETAVV